ncbi:hypothetical protein Ahia01_000605900 [Argonauta hians]
MEEFVAPKAPVNISNHFLLKTHCVRFGVPLEYMEPVLTALLERIASLRSEGRRVPGDTCFTTTSLPKIIKRKMLHPTNFCYDAIANDSFTTYYEWCAKEFKENLLADTILNEDKIFLNFYYIDDLTQKERAHLWETWKIRVVINPMKTIRHIERDLNYLFSAIAENVLKPLPRTISLQECKHVFKCCQDQTWLYRHFVRQGSNSHCDHVLHINADVENVGTILNIIFEIIIFYRCTDKITRSEDGRCKREAIPYKIENFPEFDISYPRICCNDLGKLLRSRADYCRAFIQKEHTSRKIKTFYLSFYRLKETDDLSLVRKFCEQWQIDCQMTPVSDSPYTNNLADILAYIDQSDFPDSLKTSQTIRYDKLYKHYFTNMSACTPPRFYIHS